MKKSKGFTLAEVLITLGIIGVVAAMTIPTLMANQQKYAYVQALKKFVTVFNQALSQYASDNGCVGDLAGTGLYSSTSTPDSILSALKPYLVVNEYCGQAAGCFASGTKNLDGSTNNNDFNTSTSFAKLRLADGTDVAIGAAPGGYPNCTYNLGSGVTSNFCGNVYVDVNGDKGPNQAGRDWFAFVVTGSGQLYPRGGHLLNNTAANGYWWDNTGQTANCTPETSTVAAYGLTCSGRIIEKGWQMDY